jgi:hypothetical protein
MKKAILTGAIVGLIGAVLVLSMAASPMDPNMMMMRGKGMMGAGKGMMEMQPGCMMMSSTGKMMHACPMHAMMMHNMMSCQMVATEDGGVIIMGFGKLTKYDKDLNVVKEVDVKIDVEAMKKMMTQMMEACPMCKKMTEQMEKGKMMEKSGMMEQGGMMGK